MFNNSKVDLMMLFQDGKLIMVSKQEFGRGQSWPIWKKCSIIHLERMSQKPLTGELATQPTHIPPKERFKMLLLHQSSWLQD
jgi:hypothetical protein